MSGDIGEDLKKMLLAGVGAMAMLAEKSVEWANELTEKGAKALEDAQPFFKELEKKGDEVLKQGKVLSEEMRDKIKETLEVARRESEQMDLAEVKESLDGLSDDALGALEAYLRTLKEARAREAEADGDDSPDDGARGTAHAQGDAASSSDAPRDEMTGEES